jgi:hypothetical protein
MLFLLPSQSSDDDTENLVRSRVSHKEASDRFKNSVVESSNTGKKKKKR